MTNPQQNFEITSTTHRRSPMRAVRGRLLRRPDGPERPHPPVHAVRLQQQRRPQRHRQLQPHDGRVPPLRRQHRRIQLRALQVGLLRRRARPQAAGRPAELPALPGTQVNRYEYRDVQGYSIRIDVPNFVSNHVRSFE